MSSQHENTHRLAKNTAVLYFRMLITLCIGLYTSRVVIRALGIDDYGVYDVVAGSVTMFSIFTSSLSTAISRFITFHLVDKDKSVLRQTFSASITIQLLVSAAIIVVGIPLGLWMVNHFLEIPTHSIADANWVLVCAIFTFTVNLISVPYNAEIIAHERMAAFAKISILEVCLKLAAALSLTLFLTQRLAIYAVLQLTVAIITRMCYANYCRRKFDECRFKLVFNRNIIKNMFGFAGWNLFGNTAYICNTQGVNIISNIFFGVVVNAGRGITMHVQSLLLQFANSFTTALNPQITKSYAKGDYDYLFNLIVRGAKLSFFLMLIISVPLVMETGFLLDAWLGKGEYPDFTVIFVRLCLAGTMIDFLGNSTANAVWATGHVRKYYLLTTPVGILVFPISYLLFYFGMPPQSAYLAFIGIYVILIPLRLHVLHCLIPQFKPSFFYSRVLLRILPTTIAAFIVPLIMSHYMPDSLLKSLLILLISIVSTAMCIYGIGLTQAERHFALDKLMAILSRLTSKDNPKIQ